MFYLAEFDDKKNSLSEINKGQCYVEIFAPIVLDS